MAQEDKAQRATDKGGQACRLSQELKGWGCRGRADGVPSSSHWSLILLRSPLPNGAPSHPGNLTRTSQATPVPPTAIVRKSCSFCPMPLLWVS